jgi:peptide/nickel transport system substrate-binding protein
MSTHSRRSRREFLRDSAFVGAGLAFGGPLLAACGTSSTSSSSGIAPSGGKPGRNNSLFIAGFQWGPVTNFNPLGPNSAWPAQQGSGHQHLYETLFGFDVLAGDMKGVLAKNITYPDPATFLISLYPEAHWQDGKALTADDVVYTFQLAKDHTELNYAPFWQYVTDVVKKDDHTVQISLNKGQLNPGQVKHYLVQTWILPKHIWTGVEAKGSSLLQYVDTAPVGSGPYKVYDFNAQRVALQRDDSYWGKGAYGTPAPAFIVHPIFKDNDAANLAFQSADIDFAQTFLPQIWQLWEQRKLPVATWFRQAPYHLPGQIPMIFLNLHRKGLDNPKVRQAIAYSINYAQIAETAMSRYSVPVNASLILPQGGEQKFFDQAGVNQTGWKYDKAKATSILDGLGAKKGGDGIYVLADGTRLGPWKAQCPYGWTDWMTSLQGVAESAKAVGIDISANFPEQPVDLSQLQNGDFDIAMYSATGADPSSPWARFHDVMDNRGLAPVGQTAFWNYNRFSDPGVAALLDKTAAATASEQPALYAQLDELWRQNVPTIPLEYRPLEFFEHHDKYWTGYPDSTNAKAPPTTQGAGIKWLYQIRLKG